MLPGLHLPSDPKQVSPSMAPMGSLRPNARTLRPGPDPEATPSATAAARVRRWHVALAGLVACAAIGGGLAYDSRSHHDRSRIVRSVVSGRAGLRTTPSGADERWGGAPITITIDPSLAALTDTAKDAIEHAFGAWEAGDATLPPISFDVSSTPGEAVQDGVNRLIYGPITVAGHEEDLAVTIGYAEASTGALIEADTIFNNAYDWTTLDPSDAKNGQDEDECRHRYDLQNVATHEAGHFFGLGEDTEDKTTTMYFSSRACQTSKRQLTQADIAVVSGLYASPAGGSSQQTAGGKASGCAVASAAGPVGAEGLAIAGIGVVALTVARRRRRRVGSRSA